MKPKAEARALPPSSPHRSEAIISELERRIQSGGLSAGDRLPSEELLCSEFRASRTVVRDALQALKARGLLQSRRGSGTYVANPARNRGSVRDSLGWYAILRRDGTAFLEMMDLRILVETHCAGILASGNLSLARVAGKLETMRKNRENLVRFADADIAFHLAIVQSSGHSLFLEVAQAVLPVLGKSFARLTYTDFSPVDRVLAEHTAIFEALTARDPAAAESAMRSHLELSRRNLLASIHICEHA